VSVAKALRGRRLLDALQRQSCSRDVSLRLAILALYKGARLRADKTDGLPAGIGMASDGHISSSHIVFVTAPPDETVAHANLTRDQEDDPILVRRDRHEAYK
jgi:hypothetical protein